MSKNIKKQQINEVVNIVFEKPEDELPIELLSIYNIVKNETIEYKYFIS